jgi:hypothetical protein
MWYCTPHVPTIQCNTDCIKVVQNSVLFWTEKEYRKISDCLFYGLYDSMFEFQQRQVFVSFQNFHSCSEVHADSYSIGSGVFSPEVKWPECDSDQYPPSRVQDTFTCTFTFQRESYRGHTSACDFIRYFRA